MFWRMISFGLALATIATMPWESMRAADAQASAGWLDWKQVLDRRLPAYGHRNWIVIADAAYPAQSRTGIETIATGAQQLEVVEAVIDRLSKCQHVRANVYLDAELPHVADRDAPGVETYRGGLKKLLADRTIQSLPHEEIIDKLDKAGEKFNVLILKTNLTLPYTSVFLELDCGYWSAEKEQRLREAMKLKAPNRKLNGTRYRAS